MALTNSIELPEKDIAAWIQSLAESHGITGDHDALSRFAYKLTELSGDDIEISATERRLVRLFRKNVLSTSDCMTLILMNMREKKSSQEQTGQDSK